MSQPAQYMSPGSVGSAALPVAPAPPQAPTPPVYSNPMFGVNPYQSSPPAWLGGQATRALQSGAQVVNSLGVSVPAPGSTSPEELQANIEAGIAKLQTVNPDLAAEFQQKYMDPASAPKDDGGLLGALKDVGGALFGGASKALDLLGRSAHIVPALFDPESWQDGNGFDTTGVLGALVGKDQTNWNEVFQAWGWKGDGLTGTLRSAIGLGADILTDPLTYAFGAGAGVGTAEKGAMAAKATAGALATSERAAELGFASKEGMTRAIDLVVKSLSGQDVKLGKLVETAAETGAKGLSEQGKVLSEQALELLSQQGAASVGSAHQQLIADVFEAMDNGYNAVNARTFTKWLMKGNEYAPMKLSSGQVVNPDDVRDILHATIEAGTNQAPKSAEWLAAKAASRVEGGLRFTPYIPFSKYRYISPMLPYSNTLQPLGRIARFASGHSSSSRMMNLIKSGEATWDDLAMLHQQGYDALKFGKNATPETKAVYEKISQGGVTRSAFYSASERVGKMTAAVSPGAKQFRQGIGYYWVESRRKALKSTLRDLDNQMYDVVPLTATEEKAGAGYGKSKLYQLMEEHWGISSRARKTTAQGEADKPLFNDFLETFGGAEDIPITAQQVRNGELDAWFWSRPANQAAKAEAAAPLTGERGEVLASSSKALEDAEAKLAHMKELLQKVPEGDRREVVQTMAKVQRRGMDLLQSHGINVRDLRYRELAKTGVINPADKHIFERGVEKAISGQKWYAKLDSLEGATDADVVGHADLGVGGIRVRNHIPAGEDGWVEVSINPQRHLTVGQSAAVGATDEEKAVGRFYQQALDDDPIIGAERAKARAAVEMAEKAWRDQNPGVEPLVTSFFHPDNIERSIAEVTSELLQKRGGVGYDSILFRNADGLDSMVIMGTDAISPWEQVKVVGSERVARLQTDGGYATRGFTRGAREWLSGASGGTRAIHSVADLESLALRKTIDMGFDDAENFARQELSDSLKTAGAKQHIIDELWAKDADGGYLMPLFERDPLLQHERYIDRVKDGMAASVFGDLAERMNSLGQLLPARFGRVASITEATVSMDEGIVRTLASKGNKVMAAFDRLQRVEAKLQAQEAEQTRRRSDDVLAVLEKWQRGEDVNLAELTERNPQLKRVLEAAEDLGSVLKSEHAKLDTERASLAARRADYHTVQQALLKDLEDGKILTSQIHELLSNGELGIAELKDGTSTVVTRAGKVRVKGVGGARRVYSKTELDAMGESIETRAADLDRYARGELEVRGPNEYSSAGRMAKSHKEYDEVVAKGEALRRAILGDEPTGAATLLPATPPKLDGTARDAAEAELKYLGLEGEANTSTTLGKTEVAGEARNVHGTAAHYPPGEPGPKFVAGPRKGQPLEGHFLNTHPKAEPRTGVHEAGHAFNTELFRNHPEAKTEWDAIWDALKQPGKTRGYEVGVYGTKNDKELFAEAYTRWRGLPDDTVIREGKHVGSGDALPPEVQAYFDKWVGTQRREASAKMAAGPLTEEEFRDAFVRGDETIMVPIEWLLRNEQGDPRLTGANAYRTKASTRTSYPTDEDWNALVESLRTHGWKKDQPMTLHVRHQDLGMGDATPVEAIDGTHRLLAAQEAGVTEVPVTVSGNLDSSNLYKWVKENFPQNLERRTEGTGAPEALATVPTRVERAPDGFRIVGPRTGVNDSWLKVLDTPEGDLRIEGALVPAEARGQGHAQAMYLEAAKLAESRGGRLLSDQAGAVSPDAERVWAALKRKGYDVTEEDGRHVLTYHPPEEAVSTMGTDLQDEAFQKLQTEWGGWTYNPRTGTWVTPEDGRFAGGLVPNSESIHIANASANDPEAVKAAIAEAEDKFKDVLSKDQVMLGAFRDEKTGLTTFEPTIMVHDQADAEAIATSLGDEGKGGFYDFETGNGVFPMRPPTRRPPAEVAARRVTTAVDKQGNAVERALNHERTMATREGQKIARLKRDHLEGVRALASLEHDYQGLEAKMRPAVEAASTTPGGQRFMRDLDVPGLRGVRMHEYLAEEVEWLLKDRPVGELRRAWKEFVLNPWKKWATYRSPGFHVRNVMGAWFNNAIGGVTTQDYHFTQRIMNARDGGDWATRAIEGPEFRRLNLHQVPGMHGMEGKMTYGQLADAMSDMGMTRGSATAVALVDDGAKQLSTGGKLKEGAMAGPKYLEHHLRRTSSTVEDYFRTAAWAAGMRHSSGDIYGARAFVMMRHGDYDDLTDSEEFIKDLIPFYKWMRTNIPFQFRTLAEEPGKLLMVQKAQRSLYEATGVDAQEYMKSSPDWMKQSLNVPLPWTGGSDADPLQVLSLQLPMGDLYKGTREFVGGMLPVVSDLLESTVLKEDVFSGRALTGKMVPLASWADIPGVRSVLGALPGAQMRDGQTYIPDTFDNVLSALPIYGRFRNWLSGEPNRVEHRWGALTSFFGGAGIRAIDLNADEQAFYYDVLTPTLEMYQSMGVVFPGKEDLLAAGRLIQTPAANPNTLFPTGVVGQAA